MDSWDNLPDRFIHLECRRRERERIIICDIVPDESQTIRLATRPASQ